MAKVETISQNKAHRDYSSFFATLFFASITLLFFLAFFRNLIFSSKVPFSFLLDTSAPKYRAFSTLMSGQYPKWDPYMFLGLPFVGDNASNPLDIFNLSFLFFEPVRGYVVSLMAVFFVGQLAFYLFARCELKLASMPAAAGSALFILNGFVLELWQFRTIFAPIVLTPLAFMLFKRAVDRCSYSYSIWCGAFCAIIFFMTVISWSLNPFILFGFYAIYKASGSLNSGEGLRGALRPAAYFFAVLMVFVAVAAIELIPMAHLVANSQRLLAGSNINFFPFNYLGGLIFPLRIELPVHLGLKINLPSAMFIGAAGIALASLGAIKFWRRGSLFYLILIAAPSAAFFLLFRIDAVDLFLKNIPLLGNQELRRLMLTLYPLSTTVLVAFGLQYLWENLAWHRHPACGFKGLSIPTLPHYLIKIMLAVNLTAGAIFALLFFGSPLLKPLFISNLQPLLEKFISPGSAAHPYPMAYYNAKALDIFQLITSGAVFWGIASAVLIRVAALVSLGAAMRSGGRFSVYLLSALLMADMFHASTYDFYEAKKYRDSVAIAFLKTRMSPGDRAVKWFNVAFPDAKSASYDYEKLKAQRLKFVEEYSKTAFYPNMLMFFGVPEMGGVHSLFYWRYLEYIDNIDNEVVFQHRERSRLRNTMMFRGDPDDKLLDMLGMRYIFSQKALSSPKLKLLMGKDQNERGLYLYENMGAMPRAYVVRGEKVFDRDEEVLRRLKSADFDPRRRALIHPKGNRAERQEGGMGPVIDAAEGSGFPVGQAFVFKSAEPAFIEARIVDYEPNSVKIEAAGFDGAYLVLSDNYFPGWKATVDGSPAEVYRANYLMRAVSLGPGEHQVEFYFDPPTFKAGAAITIGALLFIVAHLCSLAVRRGKELIGSKSAGN